MRLTEALIQQIDGFSGFSFNVLTQVIDASLNNIDLSSLGTHYPELVGIADKKFIKGVPDAEARIDICLVLLSGLSYEYSQNSDRL